MSSGITRPLPSGPSLGRPPHDDLEVDLELLVRDRGSIDATPRVAELDPESCDLLGISQHDNRAMIALVCEALATLLVDGHHVDVVSFGTFKLRTYRPVAPPLLGDFSFVETPYSGPVEFVPAATLLRQIDSEQLDASQAPRCDQLYSVLRDDPRLPRAKVPQLIKLTFRVLLEVLLAHQSVLMPHIGHLTLQRRPNTFRLDTRSGELKVQSGHKTVILHPLINLAKRLPGVSRIRAELTRQAQETPETPQAVASTVALPSESLAEGATEHREGTAAPLLDVDDADSATRHSSPLQVFVADEDDVLRPAPDDEEQDASLSARLAVPAKPNAEAAAPESALGAFSARAESDSGAHQEQDDEDDGLL